MKATHLRRPARALALFTCLVAAPLAAQDADPTLAADVEALTRGVRPLDLGDRQMPGAEAEGSTLVIRVFADTEMVRNIELSNSVLGPDFIRRMALPGICGIEELRGVMERGAVMRFEYWTREGETPMQTFLINAEDCSALD